MTESSLKVFWTQQMVDVAPVADRLKRVLEREGDGANLIGQGGSEFLQKRETFQRGDPLRWRWQFVDADSAIRSGEWLHPASSRVRRQVLFVQPRRAGDGLGDSSSVERLGATFGNLSKRSGQIRNRERLADSRCWSEFNRGTSCSHPRVGAVKSCGNPTSCQVDRWSEDHVEL